MSVGVCVINRNGIALAADSAGTFTGNKMFYNSINKIFKISQKNICGAIIYDNLSIYNVSVEQILKEFSFYLDTIEKITSLYDIVPAFCDFIKYKNNYYKFDENETTPCHSLITALINDWGTKIQSVINDADASEKISDILKNFNNVINASNKIQDFDVSQHINSTYRSFYDTEIVKIVPKIDVYSDAKETFWGYICDYFNLPLSRENNETTGIFFAGYGAEDAYAKYIRIQVRTIIGGQLKFVETGRFEAVNNNAKIQPLAQDDIVNTFCKGISKEFVDSIPNQIKKEISKKIDSLSNTFTDVQKEELRTHFEGIDDEINKFMAQMIRKENVEPLMKSTMLITLPEMAFLSENLVNITSLKRTYSLDGYQQTVGGQTDVAVISKGDGFVWIKNKTL